MISVIIPVYNEEKRLSDLLQQISRETTESEVIVVDGGSKDASVSIAESFDVRIVCCDRNRGLQLHKGVLASRGDILFFLHADSIFPRDGLIAIRGLMNSKAGYVGGNFRLLFDGNTNFSKKLGNYYRWIRERGEYFGDSGIYIKRDIYFEIGGFAPLHVMEDRDLVQRMEKRGPTCCVENPPLVTSSRRFHGRRSSFIICGWLWMHLLYGLGIPSLKLGKCYDKMKAKHSEANLGQEGG